MESRSVDFNLNDRKLLVQVGSRGLQYYDAECGSVPTKV